MRPAGRHFYLVEQPALNEVRPSRSDQDQLCLFDYRPIGRVACLPMMDVHGAVFRRAFERLGPRVLIDVRRAPFFDLVGLGRNNALQIIDNHVQAYLRIPLDLRAKSSSEERWKLKRQVADLMHRLAGEISTTPNTAILLLNRAQNVDFFVRLVPSSNTLPFSWQFEGPDASILHRC